MFIFFDFINKLIPIFIYFSWSILIRLFFFPFNIIEDRLICKNSSSGIVVKLLQKLCSFDIIIFILQYFFVLAKLNSSKNIVIPLLLASFFWNSNCVPNSFISFAVLTLSQNSKQNFFLSISKRPALCLPEKSLNILPVLSFIKTS